MYTTPQATPAMETVDLVRCKPALRAQQRTAPRFLICRSEKALCAAWRFVPRGAFQASLCGAFCAESAT